MAYALSASAQDSLYINKGNGLIIPYAISSVDSITFSRKTAKSTADTGIVINGVRWATYNVADPGKFTKSPEIAGMYYQWNSNVGWPATGNIGSITASNGSKTWNSSWFGGYTSPLAIDTWTSANDPSPSGWRVPTNAEIQTLLNSAKVTRTWTIQNSVYGEKFTDNTTGKSIFLPALGCRSDYGALGGVGSSGSYACSQAYDNINSLSIFFNSSSGYSGYNYRYYGYSVRPVSK
ncbi:MAG: hypothetical protein P4L28_01985 [Paludibacteraceae bacterium]|nr:hypothetical protein [Paludibacteraceae bacterium]